MACMRTVTLTDDKGHTLGEADLVDAHTGTGKLHLAFSVYVFSSDQKKFLMQKRVKGKMLFAGMWANTCCSHPFPDETPEQAGERRLKEELGIECPLNKGMSFVYRAEDPNGKGVEHEHVTLLIGTFDETKPVTPDPKEVEEWKWIEIDSLKKDMMEHPDAYAPWFHLGLKKVLPATR